MNSNDKIKIEIITLTSDKDISYNCDYLSFVSRKDINEFIGEGFDLLNFYSNNSIKNISSTANIEELFNKEKNKVYIYPNHKSLLSLLDNKSFIEIFENDKLIQKVEFPEGGILKVENSNKNKIKIISTGVKLIENNK